MPNGQPFPGFSLDHFNYGLQMGQDNHGDTEHPWENPFMRRQAAGFNPPGQPGMGDMPGPGMAVGPQGPMGLDYGGFAPPEGAGDPTGAPQGGAPQGNGYQGASPWGVWGDQDLVNDPAYAANAQTAHPKWNRFLQYMNTPEAKDSMMLGVIMSRIGVDPEGTLKLAMQFREHQAQRAWQAQQGELQREATKENVKLRGEYMREQKEDAQKRTLYYKIDSARKDLANKGKDPGALPEDDAAFPAYYEDLRTQQAKATEEDKLNKESQKNRVRAFSEAGKTGVVPKDYADDPMVEASAQAFTDRKLRADERLELARNRENQLKTIRERLPDMALQAKNLNNVMGGLEKDINRYEDNIFKIESGLYSLMEDDDPHRRPLDNMIGNYQKKIDTLEEKRLVYQDKWDKLVTTRGEKQPEGTMTPTTPSGTTVRETAGPGEDERLGYMDIFYKEGKAAADAAWEEEFPGHPKPEVK